MEMSCRGEKSVEVLNAGEKRGEKERKKGEKNWRILKSEHYNNL